ncbi:MAG: prepilin-type N-terminal cleavage/methylation domain-containing protein [Rhodoferax sp.]|nr:prepilin-type N-terminal cleavage/methylation domain-containing protein [Rhodoferax sp.]
MSLKIFTPPQQRRQRGYGLVEVMISLVIIAILVAIAVALSINLRTSSSITANTQQITQIAANAKKVFGVTNQFSAIQQSRAVRSLVPRELRTFNPGTQQYENSAFNNFGGEIYFGFSFLTQNADTMTFVWQNVPKDQCEQIVTQTAGQMRRVEVQVGTGAGVRAPALTATSVGAAPLYQSAAVGQPAVAAAQVGTATTVGSVGAQGILVKANDVELNAGALNDACAAAGETVNLWYWVGRS